LNASELTAARLSGLRHRSGDIPVLALHGWLDNAQSFVPMFEYLDGIDLVAPDLPGHGRSARRPAGTRYHFDDYVFDVVGVAEDLGWAQFHLLGHSLGGAVSTAVAAACPDRVRSLTLIEGLGPISARPDATASGWRKAIRMSRERPRRIHANAEAAARARASNTDLTLAEARLLGQRGLIEDDEGARWSHDRRLTWPSTLRYTEAQVIDLIAAIEAPSLNIYSDPPSNLVPWRILERRLAALKHRQLFSHPGGHHLHMQYPAVIGTKIKDFIHACDIAS